MILLSLDQFVSTRKTRQAELEAELRPVVRRSLDGDVDTHGWIELLYAVRDAWKRTYTGETGLKSPQMPRRFRDKVEKTLRLTDRSQIDAKTLDNITTWLATAIFGNVTKTAADDDPADLFLEWVDMHDHKVRPTHRDASGQRVEPGKMFKVGTEEMEHPGDTTAGIEEWINCRCSLRVVLSDTSMQAAVDGQTKAFTKVAALAITQMTFGPKLGLLSGPVDQTRALAYLTEDEVRSGDFDPADLAVVDPDGNGWTPFLEWIKNGMGVKGDPPPWRDVSSEERKKDADAGRALPDGSFPIDNCSDLKNAIQAIGRAKDPAKAKAHIRKRKSALGCSEVELPDTWALGDGPLDEDSPAEGPDDVPASEPTHAGLAVYTHDTNRVLLIQRRNDPEDAPDVQGTWEFPGGGREGSETTLEAAQREFCEETGLPVPDGEIIASSVSEDGVYELFVMLVDHESEAFEKLNPDEGDMVDPDNPERRHPDVSAWFTVEQIQNLGPALRPECHNTDWSLFRLPEDEEESMTAAADTKPEETGSVDWLSDFNKGIRVPFHSVWTVEGMKTGDGRRFSAGTMRTRPLPLPLGWQKSSAEGHMGNVTVAKTERLTRVPISEGRNEIRASGYMLMTEEAAEVIALTAEFGRFGISVDADDATMTLNEEEGLMDFVDSRAAGATIVAIPAFAEAWFALGEPPEGEEWHGEDLDVLGPNDERESLVASSEAFWAQFADVAPGITEDGPGWLTNYVDTDRLRDWWVSAEAGIEWGTPGDFNRCRLKAAEHVKPQYVSGFCANRHYDALGVWPGQEGLAADHLTETAMADPVRFVSARTDPDSLVASGGFCAPSEWFDDPGFSSGDGRMIQFTDGKWGSPLRITEEGEVFGHLARWGACHSTWADKCMIAPKSTCNYGRFRIGEVLTDKGLVATGPLTIGTGHAAGYLRAQPALEHYDNTGAAWADVVMGEDKFGIWVHGMVRPGTAPEMVHAARASALSGDWRRYGSNLELVAALSVNTPGFVVPRVAASVVGGEQMSLVAAGVVLDPTVDHAAALAQIDHKALAAAVVDEIEARAAARVRAALDLRRRKLALSAQTWSA